MGQLSLGCHSKPGTCSPGGSTGPHGALRPLALPARPVHPRLARGRPAGLPSGVPRAWWDAPKAVAGPQLGPQGRLRPCAAALGSVQGGRVVSRWESVLPHTGRACGAAGRLSLCGQSETCPSSFARTGQYRGPWRVRSPGTYTLRHQVATRGPGFRGDHPAAWPAGQMPTLNSPLTYTPSSRAIFWVRGCAIMIPEPRMLRFPTRIRAYE